MREIKFRAWNKLGDEMMFQKGLRHLALAEFEMESNLIWMQFTGLKDKNDKEIYEGDIVSDYNNKLKSCIRFEGSMFIVCNDDYEDSYVPLYDFCNCEAWCEELEVIGNIYENPELIK